MRHTECATVGTAAQGGAWWLQGVYVQCLSVYVYVMERPRAAAMKDWLKIILKEEFNM